MLQQNDGLIRFEPSFDFSACDRMQLKDFIDAPESARPTGSDLTHLQMPVVSCPKILELARLLLAASDQYRHLEEDAVQAVNYLNSSLGQLLLLFPRLDLFIEQIRMDPPGDSWRRPGSGSPAYIQTRPILLRSVEEQLDDLQMALSEVMKFEAQNGLACVTRHVNLVIEDLGKLRPAVRYSRLTALIELTENLRISYDLLRENNPELIIKYPPLAGAASYTARGRPSRQIGRAEQPLDIDADTAINQAGNYSTSCSLRALLFHWGRTIKSWFQ